jgi:predicted DNA-binding mobile mystery protein A
MRSEFKALRVRQLDRELDRFRDASAISRPVKGWLRAVREALGISSREMGRRMGSGHQLVLQLERSEAGDAITLKSLRNAADALECDLVYALVPRAGSIRQLNENRIRGHARGNVLGVEHSMALEGQAAGRLEEAIETEARRLTRGNGSR